MIDIYLLSTMKAKMSFFILFIVFYLSVSSFKTKLTNRYVMMINSEVLSKINNAISQSTASKFQAKLGSIRPRLSGGGGTSVGTLSDENSNQEYFYKLGSLNDYNMLAAEYLGIKEMFETQTIRVPKPICYDCVDSTSFVIFEKLPLGGYGSVTSYIDFGVKLADMHRCTAPNGQFGWKINNTIGATLQINTMCSNWADFWDEYRLGYMLHLCKREGAVFPQENELRRKVHSILKKHTCVPSLVHGDLWSGNKGFLTDGQPVIFDPATYYGDREVDIAMTYLFGSFHSKFYESYNDAWELPDGHEQRQIIYNLYHILNHFVLFGGSYLNEANSMISTVLKF